MNISKVDSTKRNIKRKELLMGNSLTVHIDAFIVFLGERRKIDAIMENGDFLAIAQSLHLRDDSLMKAADHFNWVSACALPEPAVKSWISRSGRNLTRS